jgi:hypothetical protein
MLRTETATAMPVSTDVPSVGATSTLRRALVVAGDRFATPQDQMDCAELLLSTGFPDAARILYEMVFIRTGFSSRSVDMQRAIVRRTGLWQDLHHADPLPVDTGIFVIDRAVADLKRLMAIPLDPDASRLPIGPDRDILMDVPQPGVRRPDLDGAAFGEILTLLYGLLARGDGPALADIMDMARERIVVPPEYALAAHFNADIVDLAAMVAFNALRRFLRANHALAWAPFGSPALFAAAARIEEGGLGPYLTNMPCLIRNSRDILGLLDLAGLQVAGPQREPLERWCVLLAAHLSSGDQVALADDLGDLGLLRALCGLLDAARRNPDRRSYLLWAIRDAALDHGNSALAIAAQTAIVAISNRKSGELVVLAEILATGDAADAAEEALVKAVAAAPHDRAAAARLAALRENRFEAYRAARGFGSSRHRSALRMRNRPDRALADQAGDPPATASEQA